MSLLVVVKMIPSLVVMFWNYLSYLILDGGEDSSIVLSLRRLQQPRGCCSGNSVSRLEPPMLRSLTSIPSDGIVSFLALGGLVMQPLWLVP